eukprot:3941774-Rhodomonas_salina.1
MGFGQVQAGRVRGITGPGSRMAWQGLETHEPVSRVTRFARASEAACCVRAVSVCIAVGRAVCALVHIWLHVRARHAIAAVPRIARASEAARRIGATRPPRMAVV